MSVGLKWRLLPSLSLKNGQFSSSLTTGEQRVLVMMTELGGSQSLARAFQR